ncbi:MAG TPA: AAA family ATPase, partial [Steroidobacteraceae bacterium]
MALELRFLGDLQVIRDGERLELPPSKKTRALLAYLVLTRRPQRREHLCELFWEIPDDPRGSLRWSLSKLRRLVDEPGRERIRADRLTVAFDASDVEVDVLALEDIASGDLERHSLAHLESAVTRYCGSNPLEGLELPAFGDFDAWCTATRESVTRAQLALLRAVIRRMGDDAERALPHAHTLVRISPYDEAARAMLICMLLRLGRHDQARQQYQIGERMLKEAGVPSSGELRRALSAPLPASLPAPQVAPAVPKTVQERSASAAAEAPPLVGRDAELERIISALSQGIEQRRAALVLLCGEPGIGKSRLLEAVTERVAKQGVLLLQACAYESESIRPFALWVDALRRLGPEAASAMFGSGDHANRERLFAGLSDFVGERVRTQPVLLAFDDLQWGDESSAAALHYVVRTHADQPLLGILAARDDELRDNAPFARAVRELRQSGLLVEQPLGPMPERALREIISTRAPQADSERLSRECGGNPLLAIELARAEAAGDSGQSLSELVQERLARFDLDGGEVLRWAAVLAPRIDASTLARVTGLDWNRIGEVLESAARQAMLVPVEQGFRFSHDLIARSIYAGIPAARRRTMHRRAAEVLEQDTALDPERAADLAHHAAQSG